MSAAKKKKSSKKNKSNQKNKQQNNQSNQVKVYNTSNKVDDIKVDNTAPTKVVEAIRIKDADVEISTLKNDIVEDVSGLQAAIVETQIQAREEKAAMEAEIDKEIANEQAKEEIKEEIKEVKEEKKENKKTEKKELIKSKSKSIINTSQKPEYVEEMLKNKKRKSHIITTSIVVTIFLILISTVFAIMNLDNTKIIKGVSIKNLDVSNLSGEETLNKLNEIINKELIAEIDLVYGDEYKVTLKPEQIEFKYEIEKCVEDAYQVGRKGNILTNNYSILYTYFFGRDIKLTYTYNGELLNQFIQDMNSKIPGVVVAPTYYIENNQIIITKGIDGIQVKGDELKNQIIQAILERNASEMTDGFEQVIEIPTESVKADKIDMDKIYSEIHTEPKDAYFETEPYKIYPDIDGVDLAISVEDAKKAIEAEDKQEYIFDLKITEAEKTVDDLGTEAFPYLISQSSTKYDASNRNRSTNLEIAAQKINGKVLMPGEEFSFNKVVGKRTVEEGYKDAKIYADGGVVDGLAGGICQISSTLYNSVLLANLQITERRNHSFTTSYLPAGKDATVVWGTTDFRFINSRSYPIKLEASVSNGVAEFKIHGMQEETEYEVRILPVRTQSIPFATTYEEDPTVIPGQQIVKQAGHAGCKVTTYKELRLNGEVVSKEAISNDTYQPMRRIVRVAPGHVPVAQ